MSQKNKPSTSASRVWQRHALAKACALALAGVGTVAQAQTFPGAALVTNFGTAGTVEAMSGSYWSSGYNSLWENFQTVSGAIAAPINTTTVGSALSGTGGSYPVAITGNSILASALGNDATKSQTTLNRVNASNDGALSLNLQIFRGLTGLVDGTPDYLAPSSVSATLDNSGLSQPLTGTVYITQTGLGAGNLSLSNNTLGASATLNSLDTSVTVATPAGYASASKGLSNLSFNSNANNLGSTTAPQDSGSTGSVNLSNMQGVFNATGTAEVTDVNAVVKVAGSAEALSSTISANGNSISASTTNNAAVSVFRSTADSAAFTGSVGVTNLQSTNMVTGTPNQLAKVTGSGVNVDLQNGEGSTSVSGAVTVGNNTVLAFAAGNTAGTLSSTGSVVAGNALIFEGGNNITGVGTTRATDLTASVAAGQSEAKADLLINSVQLNNGNTFTASLGTSGVTSQLDALIAGGSLSQSGNILSATATNNLAGNLISAGQTSNVGSMAASSVLLSSQKNTAIITLAESQTASITATAASSNGAAMTLSSNSIQATAQGNLASNAMAFKADQLSVGSNNGDLSMAVNLNPAVSAATSGLAISAVNVQTNAGSFLTALNQAGNLAMTIAGATTNTQASVTANQMAANAAGNSANNQIALQSASASGLNAGVSNLQINTGGSVAATSGSSSITADNNFISMSTGASSGSQLTLGNNSISAQAQLNTASNTLTSTQVSSTGAVGALGDAKPADLASLSVNADLVLANSQLNDGASAQANGYGTISVQTTAIAASSAVQQSRNQLASLAEGNAASNALTLNNGTMSGATAALASNQRGTTAADITSTTQGLVTMSSTAVSGASNVSVIENTLTATAVSNTVGNSLTVSATNAVGLTTEVLPSLSYDFTQTVANADLLLANQQKTDTSDVLARTGSSAEVSVVSLTVGAVSAASDLTFNKNTLSSAAYANKADNAASLSLGTITGMSTGLINAQESSGGTLTSETFGQASVSAASLNASNLSAAGNAVTSTARSNTADNRLVVTATNAAGRGSAGSFTATNSTVSADYALNNVQRTLDMPVTASTEGDVKLTIGSPQSPVAVSTGSNVSLNTTTVSAYGSRNFANNQMSLDISNLSNATQALSSVQVASQEMAATATDPATISAKTQGSVVLQSGLVEASNVALNGNAIQSKALDNVVGNQLVLTGTFASGTSDLAMTGLASPLSVFADLSLVNSQLSERGTFKSETGVANTPVSIAVSIGGVNSGESATTGGSVTAKDNIISSLVYVNNAVNQLGVSTTTLSEMSSALSNAQKADEGALVANSYGDVKLTSSAAVKAASLTVDNNNVSAMAGANEAFNKLSVTSSNVVGRNVGSDIPVQDPIPGIRVTNAGALTVATDFALGNEQQTVAGTTLQVKTVGSVQMDLAAHAADAGKLALTANSLSAYGSVNNATNQLGMTATNIDQSSLGLASNQSMDATSTVASTVTGSVQMASGALSGATLSATDNQIQSTALGNVVANSLGVKAASYTGPTALAAGVKTQAGASGTSSTADIAIANVQNNLSQGAVSATAIGSVNMAVGAVTSASSLSLADNRLKALAQSNSTANELQMEVTQLTAATAGLTSYQNSLAAVSATLESPAAGGLFAITTSGNLNGASLTVSGNKASALAGINEAFNTLTVSGSNLIGRTGSITTATAGTASSTGADFALMNAQKASTSATALVDMGLSGFNASITSEDISTGSSVAITANEVLARASANTASNGLTLTAANRLEASGVVNNVQDMVNGTTVKATVASGAAIAAEFGTASGDAMVAVKNNTVTAQATGNVANNALNASATTGIAQAGSSATAPTFAVLNHQSTGTSPTDVGVYGVQSAINGITVGGSGLGGALNGGHFTVTGNQLTSVAYGNSANNAVNVSTLAPGLNTASASITNVQYNMASIDASITGANLKGSGTVGTSGGSVNIGGNSIVAMAVGNRSVNAITGR